MKRLVVLASFLVLLVAPQAQAAFLNGTLEYDWIDASLTGGAGGPGFDDATTVTSPAGGDSVGEASSGDFTAIAPPPPLTTGVTVANLNYGSPGAISPFVTFTSPTDFFVYSFYVTSFTVALATEDFLNIIGAGYWTSTNPAWDLTLGKFTVAGSQIDGTHSVGGTLFALGAPLDVVPEPASMILLGSGLVGIAGAARRRYGKRS